MSRSKFPFGKKKEKKTEAEENLASAEDRAQAAVEKARSLLHSDPCKAFLEDYQRAEREIIDALIKYSKEKLDPLKFGNGARVILLQLVNLRTLIDKVHEGTGEKYTNA